tara:strand:+ start:74 stop:739 length:666 start_codon:yes stop_codon:yes gene_type:complete
MISYIKKTSQNKREYRIFGKSLFVVDPLPSHIDMEEIIDSIQGSISRKHFDNVDVVYVGRFSSFLDKNINAMYLDNALYITNEQDSGEDLIDDIIHEVAHAVEEKYFDHIYGDGLIEREFLVKRNRLKQILLAHDYNVHKYDFSQTIYNSEFDNLLYQKIGYEKLQNLINGLFLSPYAATSMREYFANAYEHIYAFGEGKMTSKISPVVYKKILSLEEMEY